MFISYGFIGEKAFVLVVSPYRPIPREALNETPDADSIAWMRSFERIYRPVQRGGVTDVYQNNVTLVDIGLHARIIRSNSQNSLRVDL
ncbi:hypothetical protein D3C76_1556000 [compost metagenome]